LGQYIYKTKCIDYDVMALGPIGFYDFWYKPYGFISSSRPWELKAERMRDAIADRLLSNHPEGIKYAAYAPVRHGEKWDKTRKMALYCAPGDMRLRPVESDEGRRWESTFALKNIVGVVWGAKGGKKHVDTSAKAIWEIIVEQYFSDPERTYPRTAAINNNLHILKQIKEHHHHAYRYGMLDHDAQEKYLDNILDKSGPNAIMVSHHI
jgi:hypothetical protein